MQSAIIISALFRVVNNDMGITGSILSASSHLCYFCSAFKKNSNLHDTWPCSTFRSDLHLGKWTFRDTIWYMIYHASSMHCIRFKLIKKLLRSLNIPGLIDFARMCPYNSKMQYFQKPIYVSYKCKSNRALSQLQASNDETINTHLMTLIIFKLILPNLNLFEHF